MSNTGKEIGIEWKELYYDFCSPSNKRRNEVIKKKILPYINQQEKLNEQDIKASIKCVIDSAHRLKDHSQQQLISQFVQSIAKREIQPFQVLSLLLKALSKRMNSASCSELSVFVQILCYSARVETPLAKLDKDSLNQFILIILKALAHVFKREYFNDAAKFLHSNEVKAFIQLLLSNFEKGVNIVLSTYISQLQTFIKEEQWTECLVGLTLLLEMGRLKTGSHLYISLFQKQKNDLIEIFKKVVIRHGVKAKRDFWESYQAFFENLDENEIKSAIEIFDLGLKRSRETVATSLVEFIRHARCDSKVFESIMEPVLQLVKSSDIANRELSIAMTELLATKTKDPSFFKKLVTTLLSYLKGAGLGVPEKSSLFQSLLEILKTPIPPSDFEDTTLQVYNALEYIIQSKVGSEQTRREASEVAVAWMIKVNKVHEPLIKTFSGIMDREKTENVLKFVLKSLGDLAITKELAQPILKLKSKFINIITSSEKKIAERGTGIHALRVLFKLGVFFPEIMKETIITRSIRGFLMLDESYERYNDDDKYILADLALTLFSKHTSFIDPEKDSQIFKHFAAISGSKAWKARLLINQEMKSIREEKKELHKLFLAGIVEYLDNAKKSDIQSGSSLFIDIAPPPNFDKESLPKLILYGNHPYIVKNNFNLIWDTYVAQYPKIKTAELIMENMDQILNYLLENLFGDETMKTAACYALSGIISTCGKEGAEAVLSRLGSILEKNREELNKFTDIDIDIFFTPEDEVYRDIENEDYNPMMNEMKIVKSEREAKKYDLTAEEWDEIFEKEQKLKKSKKSEGKDIRQELIKEKYMEKEAKVRSSVKKVRDEVLAVLKAISILCTPKKNKKHLQKCISLVSLSVAHLLSSPLVGKEAFEAFKKLFAVCTQLKPIADIICRATFRLLGGDNDESRVEDENDILFGQHVITKIRLETKGAALDPETFSTFLPFLWSILEFKYRHLNFNQATRTIALTILSNHAGMRNLRTSVRREVLRVLIDVLKYYPYLNSQAGNALISAGKFMVPKDLDPILDGLLSPAVNVRTICLRALAEYPPLSTNNNLFEVNPEDYEPVNPKLVYYLFLATLDSDQTVAESANKLWKKLNKPLGDKFLDYYMPLLEDTLEYIRKSAAIAIGAGLQLHPQFITEFLKILKYMFEDNEVPTGLNRSLYEKYELENSGRLGVATALFHSAHVLRSEDLIPTFDFIISEGLLDPVDEVREEFVKAGLNIISHKGKDNIEELLPLFEKEIEERSKLKQDYVVGSIVIFMGSLAKDFPDNDKKLITVINNLIRALGVHSMAVQSSVCDTLAPLIPKIDEKVVDGIIEQLYEGLKKTKISYGDKRGFAYGLIGCISGFGLQSIKDKSIMQKLESIARHERGRESAMICFEILATKFGILFEPYVVEIMPYILEAFSDSDENNRLAANDAANAIMANMTGHGVRMILPELLNALKPDADWRKKKGAVQVLGSMAFCAPRQLANCLPVVVKHLREAIHDTSMDVAKAAEKALARIGGVVANPEIKQQVPLLLKAISNPDQTEGALETLMYTRFVHSVDAASLSLLMPVLYTGLNGRHVMAKKKAAQIVGSMSSLISDYKALAPYVPTLMPLLQTCLSDPHPQVRSSAARAIGTLSNVVQDASEIENWLLTNVGKDSNPAERSGAAQGLSEYIANKGVSKLDELLEYINEKLDSDKAYERHGYISIFTFLPKTLQAKLEPYLSSFLPKILNGFSDLDESVRDAAFQACKVIVSQYANTAIDLILPALIDGMKSFEWRTRQCSIVVLQEFLEKVAEANEVIHKKPTEFADDIIINIDVLYDVLSKEVMDNVCSNLFMLQYDVHNNVQQEAVVLWRSMVYNTIKQLRQIIKPLIDLLIENLALEDEEFKHMAAKALGDFVQKLGMRVIEELVPLLAEQLDSEDKETRQGACLGLAELTTAAGKNLSTYAEQLLPAVKKAICDPDPDVQDAASGAFTALLQALGNKVVGELVEELLKDLEKGDDYSISGMKHIVKVNALQSLPKMIPELITTPITSAKAKALAAITEVSGSYLRPYIVAILDVLVKEVPEKPNPEDPISAALSGTVLAVTQDNLDILIESITSFLRSVDIKVRRGACFALELFFKGNTLEITDEIPSIVEPLLRLFSDPDTSVVNASWRAVDSLIKSIRREEFPDHITTFREIIKDMTEDDTGKKNVDLLPGFNLPHMKGIQPLVTLYLEGLMFGKNADIREQAALALGETLELTSAASLKPFVMKITGPLIRIVGERYPWQVKAAILQTLNILMTRGGPQLKFFIPQLQTTFIKCLQDSTKVIRNYAADALGKLVGLGVRADALVGELHNSLKNVIKKNISNMDSQVIGIVSALLQALQSVIDAIGGKLKPQTIESVISTLVGMFSIKEDEIRDDAASKIGVCAKYLTKEQFEPILNDNILIFNDEDPFIECASLLALASILHKVPKKCEPYKEKIEKTIITAIDESDNILVFKYAVRAAGQFIQHYESSSVIHSMVDLLGSKSAEIRFETCLAIKRVAKKLEDTRPLFVFIPHIISLLKDPNNSVKQIAGNALFHILDMSLSDYLINDYLNSVDDEKEWAKQKDTLYKIQERLKDEKSDDEEGEF